MSKRIVNRALSAAIVAALYASSSYAQQPATTSTSLDEVIVTGSYIRGTPEDSAQPVDVVTAEDLAEQGSPSVVQMVKTITASQSAIGESNRYNGGAGSASINLRGFGASRTLTLLNGRRLADSPQAAFQGGGANLNFIPQAAIGRVELLKDGAAATYGSDAIGGVVNFLTRTDLDGLEVDGEYSHIRGSDGDYQANAAWGAKLEGGNVLLTFGYRHRSRLDIHERDWALTPFENAAYGGWTGAGNPGTYATNTAADANLFNDNGCVELGGVINAGLCRFQFSAFNDIVNEEDHYQVHGEFNSRIGDNVKAHTEVTFARDWVPMVRFSPANTTAQFPSPASAGGSSGSTATPSGVNGSVRYNVPAHNPGLLDLFTTCATNPVTFAAGGSCASLQAAGGVDISRTGWRAIAFAGHPTNPDKADHQSNDLKSFRVSSGLKGEFHNINWDTALTYMSARSTISTNDLLVNRIQNGLNGYLSMPGSTNPCTAADQLALNSLAPGPARTAAHTAAGCYFFNPFTNSVAVSASNGATNPFYRGNANPDVINDPLIVQSLYGNYVNEATNNLMAFDFVLSGMTGLTLGGQDEMGWAIGTQYRYTQNKNEYGDLFNNKTTPCVDSIDDGTPVCAAPNGPLEFFGSDSNSNVKRGVYAVFGELSLPILDSLNASLAARYESYPGNIGSTFDPKFSIRWQPLDWLALRGSAGTTFRAPNANTVTPGCTTGVANIGGTYRAVETCGNADLEPETAESFNVGLLFSPGNFTASVDYFLFKFEEELTAESASRMYTTLFPTGVALLVGGLPNPAHPCQTMPALRDRFTFSGGPTSCVNTGVIKIRTNNVNGPDTETSGIDLRLQYDIPQVLGGSLSAGLEATYLIEYSRGSFKLKDSPATEIAPPEDRAGQHDLVSQFFSYPQIKGNLFASYRISDYSFRLQSRYSEGTESAFGTAAAPTLKDFWQHDLIVRVDLPWETTLTGSVQNILDTDPPDAPSQFNYDYTSGNPLGRVFEIGVKKKF